MKFSKYFKLYALSSAVFVAGVVSPVCSYAAQMVKKIEISGVQRIEESTIASYMDLKVGDPVDNVATDRALKSLFATGLFADVKVEQVNGVVSVKVVENPVVNIITFEGNDAIEDDELLSEVQLRQRQVFTRSKVQSDVSRLYQLYRRQGRFSVSIQPQIIQLDQNRVNLVFEIHEGEVTDIKSVKFIGNSNYSDGKLRSVISTKESAW